MCQKQPIVLSTITNPKTTRIKTVALLHAKVADTITNPKTTRIKTTKGCLRN